jgi:transcriptional regulator with XRE-family HTH domain
MFNPRMLSLARTRRRLTAKALADEAGLAADTISRLVNGGNLPDDKTVEKLVRVLKFPRAFFMTMTLRRSTLAQSVSEAFLR